jgi:hypothetical protein
MTRGNMGEEKIHAGLEGHSIHSSPIVADKPMDSRHFDTAEQRALMIWFGELDFNEPSLRAQHVD